MLLVRNQKIKTTVDIDGIALVNAYGQNIIENSGFEKGGQRWFSYNEFEHLPQIFRGKAFISNVARDPVDAYYFSVSAL